jgi:branched-chain amino acid transport system ATP-binding protein
MMRRWARTAPVAADGAAIEIDGLGVTFGGIRALSDVTFSVQAGEVCGLIGPNGAGKSTLFKVITRRVVPSAGRVRLGQVDLLTVPAHRIASLGIMQTFQEGGLFATMTVLENVIAGAHHRGTTGATWAALRLPPSGRQERAWRDEARALLDEHDLADVAEVRAADLSFGLQRKVEVLRALMGRPRFLLLDEPAAGLTAAQRADLQALIRRLADGDLGVVLVEHNVNLVMQTCDRVIALDSGELIAAGTPQEVRTNERLQTAYLGRRQRS